MPTLRVMFKYNNRSPLSNVVTVERIKFDSKEDGTKWLAAYRVLMDRKKVDKDIVEVEWALVGADNTNVEIIKNPTGGVEGTFDQKLFRWAERPHR